MKGYPVELKVGANKEIAKKSLETVLGKGYVAFHEGAGHQETDIIVSEGMFAKVSVYHVSVDFPKPGLMAFIGSPAHIKLVDFQGGYRVPDTLKQYITNITPCNVQYSVVARQG